MHFHLVLKIPENNKMSIQANINSQIPEFIIYFNMFVGIKATFSRWMLVSQLSDVIPRWKCFSTQKCKLSCVYLVLKSNVFLSFEWTETSQTQSDRSFLKLNKLYCKGNLQSEVNLWEWNSIVILNEKSPQSLGWQGSIG